MANNQDVRDSLITAVHDGNEEIVRELINTYGLSYLDPRFEGYQLLCDALRNKHRIIAYILLNSGCKRNNSSRCHTKTPLHLAVENDFIEIVNMLLFKGADIEAKDENGWTPLYYVVFNEQYEVAELLLKHKADSKIDENNGNTPLQYAAAKGHYKVIEILLMHKYDINVNENGAWTPLHYAAFEGHYKVVELLLMHKADINVNENGGWTPLHYAAGKGHYKVVELLLMHKADSNVKNNCLQTPLHCAALKGHNEVIELLLRHKAHVNSEDDVGRTPLHYAASEGHYEVIELFLRHEADVNCGQSPLHDAALKGHYNVIELLLMHTADIDIKDEDGRTPLQCAALYGHFEIVEILLIYKVDVNDFDTYETPSYVKATVKLKTANLYAKEVNLQFMDDEINDFQNKCEMEIIKMKNMKIKNTNITFYDILTKLNKNTSWMKNKNVLEDLKTENYKTEFPMYAKLIAYQFKKGMKKNQLLEQSFEVCRSIFNKIIPLLPDECVKEILGYLSYEDLLIIN